MSQLRNASRILFVALALQPLSACAALGDPEPPVCDGRHRRPANSYGSVLVPAPRPTEAPPPSSPAAPDGTSTEFPSAGGCA